MAAVVSILFYYLTTYPDAMTINGIKYVEFGVNKEIKCGQALSRGHVGRQFFFFNDFVTAALGMAWIKFLNCSVSDA